MARIRTIKPEFPQSETIGKLSREARLLFVQLWTLVDDLGRARASSRVLASLLYPYDDDAKDLICDWLSELMVDCITMYEDAEGHAYLEIRNWLKHQKIDHPSKSYLPDPKDPSSRALASPRETLGRDLGPRTSTSILDLGPVKDSKPPRNGKSSRAQSRAFSKPTVDDVKSYCKDRQNGIDPNAFVDHYDSNGWLVGKNPMKDWKAAVRSWERNGIKPAGKPDTRTGPGQKYDPSVPTKEPGYDQF